MHALLLELCRHAGFSLRHQYVKHGLLSSCKAQRKGAVAGATERGGLPWHLWALYKKLEFVLYGRRGFPVLKWHVSAVRLVSNLLLRGAKLFVETVVSSRFVCCNDAIMDGAEVLAISARCISRWFLRQALLAATVGGML